MVRFLSVKHQRVKQQREKRTTAAKGHCWHKITGCKLHVNKFSLENENIRAARLWNRCPGEEQAQKEQTTFKIRCDTYIKLISRGSPSGDRGLDPVSQECGSFAVS